MAYLSTVRNEGLKIWIRYADVLLKNLFLKVKGAYSS